MMPETYMNIGITLVNVATLYVISHQLDKQAKRLKEFREYLESKDANEG